MSRCRRESPQATLRSSRAARRPPTDLCQRLEQLNAIGAALSRERDINRAARDDPARGQDHHARRRRHALPRRPTEQDAALRDRAHHLARSLRWAAPPATRCRSTRSTSTRTASPNHIMVAALRRAHRQDGQHRRRLHRGGLRLLRHARVRQEDRLPLEVVPDRADEEPRARDHRRAAADQRAGPGTGEIVAFSPSDQRLAESLASQAAIALTNRMLINQLEQLFESFINLINAAIDEKSPYTGGHCQRVPQLTMMLAEAVNDTRDGPLAEFAHDREGPLRAEDRRPAARLRQDHHAGARRRQGDQARDHLRPHPPDRHALRGAEARRRDRAAQARSSSSLRAGATSATARRARATRRYRDTLRQLDEDREFLRRCNIGGERCATEEQERVRADRAATAGATSIGQRRPTSSPTTS